MATKLSIDKNSNKSAPERIGKRALIQGVSAYSRERLFDNSMSRVVAYSRRALIRGGA